MKVEIINIGTIQLIPENTAEIAILENIELEKKIHTYSMGDLKKDGFVIIQTNKFYNK